MKNKARLSTMTAFSFGYHLKHLTIDWLSPFKQASFMVFLLQFTAQNETSKGSPEPKFMTLLKVFHVSLHLRVASFCSVYWYQFRSGPKGDDKTCCSTNESPYNTALI
jgi:hypothetical protein